MAMKLTVFWNLTPCSLVETYQHSAGTCYLHLQCRRPSEAGRWFTENVGTSLLDQALEIKAAYSAKTLVSYYKTTWHDIPDNSNLHFLILLIIFCSNLNKFLFWQLEDKDVNTNLSSHATFMLSVNVTLTGWLAHNNRIINCETSTHAFL